jgi:hypothetical protein
VSSAIIGDGSVPNIGQGSYLLTPVISGGKPHLSSSSLKNKYHIHSESGKCFRYTNKRYTCTASHHIIIMIVDFILFLIKFCMN